ncbi:uncharacterized protein NPIL_404731 [Nephila pilipes]|uniref:CUB domain-containing protein n=1 Tax=Nephila pilipes TaxID=299642 RepID=A0A8X6R8G0_NEPPI|nr:uncharacterized protein NPIL_404731 [Nephila pilipes]
MTIFYSDQSPACHKGYLQIVEPPAVTSALRSQQTRGFSQLISALKEPTEQLSSLFDTTRGNPQFGRFCGDMIGKSATFYTEGNNVTLRVVIPGKAALHPFSFSVYLTYKYLPKDTAPPVGPNPQPPLHQQEQQQHPAVAKTPVSLSNSNYYYGTRLMNTYCDRVLVNCDRKRCSIRSPNFPGFYLRNITCHYWVRQDHVPHGRHANIVLSQSNEYKISLYTGRSSPLSYPHVSLTEECHSDVIRIFDGPTTNSPLLIEFCGAGTLPEIISSSPEVLVQLYSSPNQVMHNSHVEIDVEVKFTDTSDYRAHNGRCEFTIDGSKHRHGLVYSPRHTVPRNTTCSFRLQGASDYDKIWFYFLSYFVEDKHPWSRRETCEVGKLELYEPGGTRKRDTAALLVKLDDSTNDRGMLDRKMEEPSYRFCEKTFPKVCARAADKPDYVPVRPCKVPDESYLSRGPGLIIKHNVYTTPELSTTSSSFTLRYEFVDMRQHGVPAASNPDPCNRRFESRTNRIGTVTSPKNVFLFGRGGSSNVSCSYEFLGLPAERVVLTFTDIKLKSSNCEHLYDPIMERHTCRTLKTYGYTTSTRTAVIKVVERTTGNIQSPLACFCDLQSEPRRPLVIESVTNHVRVSFSVTNMSPFDDFNHFGFEAVYEFLPISLCEANIHRKNGSSEGEVVFQVPSTVEGRAMPLRCRWLLEASPHKYLYLRFKGTDGAEGCLSGNKIIVYAGLPVQPLSVVCLHGGRKTPTSIAGAESASSSAASDDREVDVFSNYWYNDTGQDGAGRHVLRDHVYIEVLANHAETVRFEWMEVTKPFFRTRGGQVLRDVNCPFECPELNACIGAELWCDGRKHCPSGYDEAPAHCERFPTSYVAAGTSAGAILLLLALALITIRCRQRGEFKESRPVPTEDFPMDSPHVK